MKSRPERSFGKTNETEDALVVNTRLRDLMSDINVLVADNGGIVIISYKDKADKTKMKVEYANHVDEALLKIRERMLEMISAENKGG